jgi:hypothetical protein
MAAMRVAAVQTSARSNRLAVGAALLTVVVWAPAFVGIRYAGRELRDDQLAGLDG